MVLYWVQDMLLTFDQHISEVGLFSCGVEDVHVEKQNLGVWVCALEFVVFGL